MPAITDDAAIAAFTLEERVQLLTGRDFRLTWPNEKIGLRRMVFPDGPSGVRGEVWDERDRLRAGTSAVYLPLTAKVELA